MARRGSNRRGARLQPASFVQFATRQLISKNMASSTYEWHATCLGLTIHLQREGLGVYLQLHEGL